MEPQKPKLVPILPAHHTTGAANDGLDDDRATPNRSSSVATRARRRALVAVAFTQCDGKKPNCSRCSSKSEPCSYEAPPIPMAVKKKYDSVMLENKQYRELFNAIHKKPDHEAREIFNRLRTSNQPLSVLESVRQAEVLLPSPATSAWMSDPQLARLEQKALQSSAIQVPAKPWTVIAGDGIVSELVTDFFTWDNSYMFPVVDRATFVDEMKAGDPASAQWCSALLLIVERAKKFGIMTGQNLAERFLVEAKGLLDREQGRASVPTVQALMLMYLATTVLAYFYYQPSTIRPPNVPKPLSILTFTHKGNIDILDRPWDKSSALIPQVPGILAAACALSELFYEIMHYLTSSNTTQGSEADLHNRRLFYSRLRQLRHDMPRQLILEHNPTPATYFLRMDENEIAYTLLQGIPLNTPFGAPYNLTVKDICIQHCQYDTDIMESYIQNWPIDSLIAHQLYISMQALVPILDDPVARDLFVRDCLMAHLSTCNIRLSGILLQATQAFAWAIKKSIPEAARPYLEGWTQEVVEEDLPISFALPQHKEIRKLLASDVTIDGCSTGQLSTLIKRWALLSIAES
ncbi:hypothetical protein FSARC_1061 [Fusarium sarcochroum]|uniref:Zn(2)-C6 fungal-type domain-containing protein n=1 Tax=Fusarium sarcochroum TaxID=1208366 RepID=A0A8H4UA65_9HYPO|nr:hypothetical protein FSARC_1061 [Fusarium sarcochroum]